MNLEEVCLVTYRLKQPIVNKNPMLTIGEKTLNLKKVIGVLEDFTDEIRQKGKT